MYKTQHATVRNQSGEVCGAFTAYEVEAEAAFHALVARGVAPVDAANQCARRFFVTDEFVNWLAS